MSYAFREKLDDLKTRLARMTAMVQQAVECAVDSLVTADGKLAQQTLTLDGKIDAEEVEIEQRAIELLALYQPAATDLRFVATIIKANNDFERIADCAVNVAQRVLPLTKITAANDGRPYEPPAELRLMGNSVLSTLRDTLRAFNMTDEAMARQVLRGDDVVDALYHQIVQDMLSRMEAAGVHDASTELANIMIAKNLERMADHCTNVAEDVIYVHTGRIIRHLHAV